MQQEIKVINGQTIYDLALFCYNDATLVYDLIIENPIITDITMDLTGLTLVYTPKKVIKYEAKENQKKLNKLVTIKNEQSIFDLSLQYYGNLDNIYTLIQNNSYIDDILSDNISGNELNFTTDKNYVNEYFRKKEINIGTKASSKVWILDTGYWDDIRIWIDLKTWID